MWFECGLVLKRALSEWASAPWRQQPTTRTDYKELASVLCSVAISRTCRNTQRLLEEQFSSLISTIIPFKWESSSSHSRQKIDNRLCVTAVLGPPPSFRLYSSSLSIAFSLLSFSSLFILLSLLSLAFFSTRFDFTELRINCEAIHLAKWKKHAKVMLKLLEKWREAAISYRLISIFHKMMRIPEIWNNKCHFVLFYVFWNFDHYLYDGAF